MADGFLSRWSRLKAEAQEAPRQAPDSAPAGSPNGAPGPVPATVRADAPQREPGAARALPTLEDAMRLGPDSDYSAFVARGVDASVRRRALRTLFSDPHFNIVDGLDVYMGDYTQPDPMPPAMLASLKQAHGWLQRQLDEDDIAAAGETGAVPDPQNQGTDHPHDHNEAKAPQRAPAREHDEH